MSTYKNDDRKNKEMQERYGHLLDKYINAGDFPNPQFHRQTEEYIRDVENGRYGHLLDKAKDPSQKTYNRMMKLYDMTLESRERRNREEEHAELAAKERIRNEKESERLHNERIRSFADGLIERKKEKIEAEAAQREKEEREARKERESIERFRHYSGSVDKAREISERADEIMLRRKKREEEHKRQMAWFDSQKRG